MFFTCTFVADSSANSQRHRLSEIIWKLFCQHEMEEPLKLGLTMAKRLAGEPLQLGLRTARYSLMASNIANLDKYPADPQRTTLLELLYLL
jgi:hypothetical protein